MFDLFKEFHFDAAHHLDMNVEPGHPHSRMHGHSFTAIVTLRGLPDLKTGYVMGFEEFDSALAAVKNQLDHHYLNNIPGLEVPTLENISRWIWQKLIPDIPLLYSVTVKRGTLGEGCVFYGISST